MKLTKFVTILLVCSIGISFAVVFVKTARTNSFDPESPRHQTFPSGGVPGITDTVTITLTPGIASRLIYTDTQGLSTILEFSPETVTQTVTITLIPDLVTALPPSYIYGGNAFVLQVEQSGTLDKSFSFNRPVTTTIHYSNDAILAMDERSLHLYWWSGSDWWKAEQTCEPISSYIHNEANNTISTAICSPSQISLFGTNNIYIPLILH